MTVAKNKNKKSKDTSLILEVLHMSITCSPSGTSGIFFWIIKKKVATDSSYIVILITLHASSNFYRLEAQWMFIKLSIQGFGKKRVWDFNRTHKKVWGLKGIQIRSYRVLENQKSLIPFPKTSPSISNGLQLKQTKLHQKYIGVLIQQMANQVTQKGLVEKPCRLSWASWLVVLVSWTPRGT